MAAYTTVDDPSVYFQTALYTGNASNNTITNDGNSDLKPDLVWTKARSGASHHTNVDSSRGAGKQIYPNLTAAEESVAGVDQFHTDGFRVGSNGTANANTITHVAWQWKANGGTTATNTTGSLDSVVQANTTAGFSIVTFTSASSGNFSVGHGLGVQPAMIITKSRDGASNWWTWHKGLTGGNSNTSYVVALERTTAEASYANAWGSTGVTSSVFGMQSGNTAEASDAYVAYCFAEKQGYSKFGSYVGNGNADGPFVYTGFKPAFVMLKPAGINEHWVMHDNTRDPHNKTYHYLFANESEAEAAGGTHHIDLLSNGFKIRTSNNNWNTTSNIVYMAFAEQPLVTSSGVPATAK